MDFMFLGAIAVMAAAIFGLIAACDRLRSKGEARSGK